MAYNTTLLLLLLLIMRNAEVNKTAYNMVLAKAGLDQQHFSNLSYSSSGWGSTLSIMSILF